MKHEMIITTNHVPRPILSWWDLTPKEQKEYEDYPRHEEESYFRYRGWVYAFGDIETTAGTNLSDKWDGVAPSSYSTGILVKVLPETDEVIVGSYLVT